MPTEDLNAFLRRHPASTLADLLVELANDHPDVQKRRQSSSLPNCTTSSSTMFSIKPASKVRL